MRKRQPRQRRLLPGLKKSDSKPKRLKGSEKGCPTRLLQPLKQSKSGLNKNSSRDKGSLKKQRNLDNSKSRLRTERERLKLLLRLSASDLLKRLRRPRPNAFG